MHPERRFLLLCGAVGCASLLAVMLHAPVALRTVLALPLVFVLPGTAVLRALDLRFSPATHASITVGISIALTLLGGLALDTLGMLGPFGWAAWLSAVTVLAAIAGLRNGNAGFLLQMPAVRLKHGILLASTVAVLGLTVQSSLRATAAYRPFPNTSFWMLAPVPASTVYVIGIKNDEGRPETYAVQLMVDQRITGEWQDLFLAPGQTLTYPVTVQPGAPAQAWLYRSEHPNSIYRQVSAAGNNSGNGAATAVAYAGVVQ